MANHILDVGVYQCVELTVNSVHIIILIEPGNLCQVVVWSNHKFYCQIIKNSKELFSWEIQLPILPNQLVSLLLIAVSNMLSDMVRLIMQEGPKFLIKVVAMDPLEDDKCSDFQLF